MSKINSQVFETLPEFIVGKTYKIITAESIKTPQQGYEGIEVVAEDVPTGVMHGTMVWLRPKVGTKSKLGTFMNVLGDDYAKWIGKLFHVVSWAEKNREIVKEK